MKKKHTLAFALTLAVGLTAATACGIAAAETEALPEGYPLSGTIEDAVWFGDLQEFHATTLEGEAFTMDDLKAYDVTMINLWATWCGPCVAEMPDLARFEQSVPENVRVITCCIDYASEDEVAAVNEDAGYEGITLVGADGDLGEIMMSLEYIPTTLFFDSEGRAVGTGFIGGQEDFEAVYTEAIDSILTAMGKPEMAQTTEETESADVL